MFQTLIFDLDDTILDTYELLIPHAVDKAGIKFQQITGLLDMPLADFSKAWQTLHSTYSGRTLYEKITEHLFTKYQTKLNDPLEIERLISAIYASFLQPDLPSSMTLSKSKHELFTRLNQRYTIYLVTQGIPASQEEKINKLNIASFFKKIFIVNSISGETKTDAFKKILTIEHGSPEKFLSIGNRLSHEISMAKQLGMKTCHIVIGEHKDEMPKNQYEIADWTIYSLDELENKCQL